MYCTYQVIQEHVRFQGEDEKFEQAVETHYEPGKVHIVRVFEDYPNDVSHDYRSTRLAQVSQEASGSRPMLARPRASSAAGSGSRSRKRTQAESGTQGSREYVPSYSKGKGRR